jgi:hypothetical protein
LTALFTPSWCSWGSKYISHGDTCFLLPDPSPFTHLLMGIPLATPLVTRSATRKVLSIGDEGRKTRLHQTTFQ